MARSLRAKRIVEFGTSFGISTLYAAAAARDEGGQVIGSELEPGKQRAATAHLAEAGLASVAEVRLGDARETLRDVPGPIDLVLLDGWKELYLPMLQLLAPKLRPGAVVLADNIKTFRRALAPYVDYVQSGRNGFASVTLPLADGFEYSVRLAGLIFLRSPAARCALRLLDRPRGSTPPPVPPIPRAALAVGRRRAHLPRRSLGLAVLLRPAGRSRVRRHGGPPASPSTC